MTFPEPLLDVARGDAAVSRQLSETLRLLAANTSDSALKTQISAVLSGKQGVRDFANSDVFSQTLDRVMPSALDDYLIASEEERQQLVEEGEAQLERYREEGAEQPQVQPCAESVNSPPDSGPVPEGEPSPFAESRGAPADSVVRAIVVPGTRRPNREQIVTPDEPDEDDLYFQDRRRHGWLE